MQLGYATAYLVDPIAFIKSLDWSTGNIAQATLDAYNAGKQYGWTAVDMGSGLGFTGAQIIAHFKNYGLTWVDPVGSSTGLSSLLSNKYVLAGAAFLAWKLLM